MKFGLGEDMSEERLAYSVAVLKNKECQEPWAYSGPENRLFMIQRPHNGASEAYSSVIDHTLRDRGLSYQTYPARVSRLERKLLENVKRRVGELQGDERPYTQAQARNLLENLLPEHHKFDLDEQRGRIHSLHVDGVFLSETAFLVGYLHDEKGMSILYRNMYAYVLKIDDVVEFKPSEKGEITYVNIPTLFDEDKIILAPYPIDLESLRKLNYQESNLGRILQRSVPLTPGNNSAETPLYGIIIEEVSDDTSLTITPKEPLVIAGPGALPDPEGVPEFFDVSELPVVVDLREEVASLTYDLDNPNGAFATMAKLAERRGKELSASRAVGERVTTERDEALRDYESALGELGELRHEVAHWKDLYERQDETRVTLADEIDRLRTQVGDLSGKLMAANETVTLLEEEPIPNTFWRRVALLGIPLVAAATLLLPPYFAPEAVQAREYRTHVSSVVTTALEHPGQVSCNEATVALGTLEKEVTLEAARNTQAFREGKVIATRFTQQCKD